MSTRRWNGTEPEKMTRQKLRGGGVVRAYGGTFAARVKPLGGVLEKCLAKNTWETHYQTVDDYVNSLREVLL